MTSHYPPQEFDADSVTSTPRSEHRHMCDDSTNAPQPRVRFMCSFGGKILLRPHDNQLRYVGGDTRIVAVNRHTTFSSLLAKLSKLSGTPNITVKYQLPNEDLDALITVTADEDVENMMEEYDRLAQMYKSSRLRLFLFPIDSDSRSSTISSILDGSIKREQWFVDALNGGAGTGAGLERGRSEVSSIVSEVPDYLFGLDNPDETRPVRNKTRLNHENISSSDPGSPAAPIAPSPYCSTSSSLATPTMTMMPDLPPVKTKPDKPVQVLESKEMPQQTTSYPGSPLWHYNPAPQSPLPMQTMPVYYVPVPGMGNMPFQSIPVRAPYVQPYPVPPNQLPVGLPPVSSMGQVYGGVRPVMTMDPHELGSRVVVQEGMNQQVYYGARNVIQGYPGSGGEEMHGGPGTEGKVGRVYQPS